MIDIEEQEFIALSEKAFALGYADLAKYYFELAQLTKLINLMYYQEIVLNNN